MGNGCSSVDVWVGDFGVVVVSRWFGKAYLVIGVCEVVYWWLR